MNLPAAMELKKVIYLLLFVYGTLGKSSTSDKSSVEMTAMMPSTTFGKKFSVLREILNQESLVRFSMVQKIQKLVMDVIDNRDSAQSVKERLKEAIENLQTLESREEDLEIKNFNLSQKLNAMNEVLKINKNTSMEETKNTAMFLAKLKLKAIDCDARLQVVESILEKFLNAVNKTVSEIQENQKVNNMLLRDFRESRKDNIIQYPTACTPGKFGRNCSLDCGHCKDDLPCDFVYGTCRFGCSNGWTGVICTEQCPSGKFGERCSETCGHCSDGKACDFVTGTCPKGCFQGWGGDFCKEALLVDCLEIMEKGSRITGIYRIYPWRNETYKEVLCDMYTMGGGWTVFQKRIDGSVSFSRNWAEYRHGFGNASTEYWLGNDALHALTLNSSSLYVKLQHRNGRHYFQYYSDFRISGAGDDYRLYLGPFTNGTAGHSTESINNQTFKTPDHSPPIRCFRDYTEGGWWFKKCHSAYLNGVYGSSKWLNPWSGAIRSGTDFASSQMMTRRNK